VVENVAGTATAEFDVVVKCKSNLFTD